MERPVLARPAAVSALTALMLTVMATSGVLLSAPPAWAHARLLGTGPAADSVVARTPATVTLRFDSSVIRGYTTVVVAGTDGTSCGDGLPVVVNGEVRQKVRPLPSGRIQVTWQTVAGDGAPLQGRYTLTNADRTAAAQPAPARTPPSTATSASTSAAHASSPSARPVTSASPLAPGNWPWWAAAGALVAIATAVFVAVRIRPTGRVHPSAAGPRPPHREDPRRH